VVFSGPLAFFVDTIKMTYYSFACPHEIGFIKVVQDVGNGKNPPPATGMHVAGMVTVWFCAAKYLEEIFVTKNAFYTKHPIERAMSKPLLYNNILSMDTDDPTYKKKRKALSAAFLKSKMTQIVDMAKQTALKCFADLQAKGDENTLDMNMYTSTVQAHIIVTLMAGPNQSFKTLEYTDLNSGETSQITLAEFFDKLLTDIMIRLMKNPLVMTHEYFTDHEVFSTDKYYFKNCQTIRSFIGSIIDEKKAVKDTNASDVISLVLQDENY